MTSQGFDSASGRPIRVLIVDDSALIRKMLTALLSRQSDLQVIGAAADPYQAREMIRELDPDVLTLDVEMPRMNGLDFLERLMRLHPMPVVMLSTATGDGSEATLRALELGAVDYVCKPRYDVLNGLEQYANEIAAKVRVAAQVRVSRLVPAVARPAHPVQRPIASVRGTIGGANKLIFIGASTGGTEAIKEVLVQMPPNSPPILITQHMPEGFTRPFANRLDGLCAIEVKEAEHGEPLRAGCAFIAPGNQHMAVRRAESRYWVELSDGPVVNRHRPSVEVLFQSAARLIGRHAIGVMLTGMGKDGAQAMLQMKQAGAYTFAQDEATCVVFGMPKAAIAAGAVDEVLPLHEIAAKVLARLTAAVAT